MSDSNEKQKKGCLRALKIVAIAFGSLMVLFIAIGLLSESDDEPRPKPASRAERQSEPAEIAYYVTADDLSDTYKENEARGNNMFKGKRIEVTGYVYSVTEQEILGGYTISLEAGGGWANVRCQTRNESFATSVSKGQKIVVVGIGDGQILGSPILKECQLQQ